MIDELLRVSGKERSSYDAAGGPVTVGDQFQWYQKAF